MLLLSLLLSLAAAAASPHDTFRVRLHDDLGSLDWAYGEVNGEVVYQLMDGLFRAGHGGEPQPSVARSFRWNEDHTVLTLRLGTSRWSDGEPVCARHFTDAWDRLRSKELASPYDHYATPIESYSAKGCRGLEVRFRRPTPEGPALLANSVFFPVRLDNLKAHPAAFTEGTTLLVNGSFRVAEWKRNVRLALERNPRHAGKAAKLSRVEFRFIPEDSTAKALFELGELDWMKEVPQLLRTPALEASPEFRVFPSLIAYYFGINPDGAPLLKDPAIRRALAAALDRTEIAKILGKECRGTSSWLPSSLLPRPAPEKAPETDPKASERLRAAFAKDPAALRVYVYNKTSHKMLAEWAQGQWEKRLGVRIPLVVLESKVYWKEASTSPLPIFFGGVTAPFGHPRAFLQEFLPGASANWTGWASEGYAAAVAAERYVEAEELLERDAFVIPLYQRDTVALVKPRWKGFHVNPLGQAFLSEVR